MRRSNGDTPLEQLAAAVEVGDDLSRRADAIVSHFVDLARAGGCSWAQIGGALGVTRQAAQQQDVSRRRPGHRRRGRAAGRPFDHCTDRMRQVLVVAHDEARLLGHNWLGTEHLLLGLLVEGNGVAALALRDFGVSDTASRARVEQLVGVGDHTADRPPAETRPWTPRAKQALAFAHKEAAKLRHNYVGTEHLLLGLLAEGQGVAAQALVELGVDLPALRRRVLDIIAEPVSKD